MLHYEPDEESVYRAAELASRLMRDLRLVSEEGSPERLRRLFFERLYDQQAYGVPIIDVIMNTNQMATEFTVAKRWGFKVVCLKLDDGELAPIAMTELWANAERRSGSPEDWFERWKEWLQSSFLRDAWRDAQRRLEEENERFVAVEAREVEGVVERNLTSFLSYRFAVVKEYKERRKSPRFLMRWLRDWLLRGGSGPTGRRPQRRSDSPFPVIDGSGGLEVKVSCQTPGLRLHVSPAYYINWVFFGSPTTPVTSYLLPGRYIFAGRRANAAQTQKGLGSF